MSLSPAIYSNITLEVGLTGSMSSGAFHEVIGITKSGGPNANKTSIDKSHFGSQVSREKMPARLNDLGQFTFTLQYNPTNIVHSYIVSRSFNTQASTDYDVFRMTWNDGSNTKWAFSGSFTGFAPSNDDPAEGIATAEVTVDLTGNVNFSA